MTKKMENLVLVLVLVFSVGGVDGGCYGVVSGVVVGGSEDLGKIWFGACGCWTLWCGCRKMGRIATWLEMVVWLGLGLGLNC